MTILMTKLLREGQTWGHFQFQNCLFEEENGIGIDKFGIDKFDVEFKLTK